MLDAARSSLAAGVALIGASAIAAAPVAPPLPDIHVPKISSEAVELHALVNPLEEFADVFAAALTNVQALGARVADDPAPILSGVIANQISSAQAIAALVETFGASFLPAIAQTPEQVRIAIGHLADGDISGALTTLLNATLGPILDGALNILFLQPEVYANFQEALRRPVANLLNVIDLASPQNISTVLLGPLLSPVNLLQETVNTVGATGDALVAAIRAGDAEGFANAVLSFGPDLTGTVLNGLNPESFGAGLLGAHGIVAGLLDIRDAIAGAITAPATTAVRTADVTDTKTPALTTVNLQVTAGTEATGTDITGKVSPVAAPTKGAAGTSVTDASSTPAAGGAPAADGASEATAAAPAAGSTTPEADKGDTASGEAAGDAPVKPAKSGAKHRAQTDNSISSTLKKLRSITKKADESSVKKSDSTVKSDKTDKSDSTKSGDKAA